MDELQRERLLLTQRVMRAMRHQSARVPLADYNREGGRQVVVCLGSDTLEYVTSRVEAVGGTATVLIPRADGLAPLAWTNEATVAAVDPSNQPLHPASTVEMLLDYFVARGEHQMQFQVAPTGGVDVTEHEPIKVPV